MSQNTNRYLSLIFRLLLSCNTMDFGSVVQFVPPRVYDFDIRFSAINTHEFRSAYVLILQLFCHLVLLDFSS
jgi:hypothetical protein